MYDSRKHSAIRCTRLSRCGLTHRASKASNSSVPCSIGRCALSHTYRIWMRSPLPFSASLPVRLAANRTESHTRSRGNRPQPPAYPRLQNSRNSSCDGLSPSCPGAVQRPLHPPPSGSRSACSQPPFSNLTSGMKNGQAMIALCRSWNAEMLRTAHSTHPLKCKPIPTAIREAKTRFVVTSSQLRTRAKN